MIHIEEIENWAKLMQQAKELAGTHIADEDCGTCNHDQPVLDLTGWRKPQIEVLMSKAPGFLGTELSGRFWKKCFFLNLDLPGQANRRTKAAQTAYKFMKDNGMPVRMYYQTD